MSHSARSWRGRWTPYKPPWYPNQEPEHNPFLATDASGETSYQSWVKGLAPGELERIVREYHERGPGLG